MTWAPSYIFSSSRNGCKPNAKSSFLSISKKPYHWWPECLSSHQMWLPNAFLFISVGLPKTSQVCLASFHLQDCDRPWAPWGQGPCSIRCCVPSHEDSAWLTELTKYLLNESISLQTALLSQHPEHQEKVAGSLPTSGPNFPVDFAELKLRTTPQFLLTVKQGARNGSSLPGWPGGKTMSLDDWPIPAPTRAQVCDFPQGSLSL